MRAATLLFLTLSAFMIGWGYLPCPVKKEVRKTVRKNLFAILAATLVVAVAVFFSINTTLRFI